MSLGPIIFEDGRPTIVDADLNSLVRMWWFAVSLGKAAYRSIMD
jgi:hypothetical protein